MFYLNISWITSNITFTIFIFSIVLVDINQITHGRELFLNRWVWSLNLKKKTNKKNHNNNNTEICWWFQKALANTHPFISKSQLFYSKIYTRPRFLLQLLPLIQMWIFLTPKTQRWSWSSHQKWPFTNQSLTSVNALKIDKEQQPFALWS